MLRNDSIKWLEIEAYREATMDEMKSIEDEAVSRFNLKSTQIIHRIGQLDVGYSIILIICTVAHRKEAFEGCRYILEELKSRVTIWKKKIGADGAQCWVEQ